MTGGWPIAAAVSVCVFLTVFFGINSAPLSSRRTPRRERHWLIRSRTELRWRPSSTDGRAATCEMLNSSRPIAAMPGDLRACGNGCASPSILFRLTTRLIAGVSARIV